MVHSMAVHKSRLQPVWRLRFKVYFPLKRFLYHLQFNPLWIKKRIKTAAPSISWCKFSKRWYPIRSRNRMYIPASTVILIIFIICAVVLLVFKTSSF